MSGVGAVGVHGHATDGVDQLGPWNSAVEEVAELVVPAVQAGTGRMGAFVEDPGAGEAAQYLVDLGVVETGMLGDLDRTPPRLRVAAHGPVDGALGSGAQVGAGESVPRRGNRAVLRSIARRLAVAVSQG